MTAETCSVPEAAKRLGIGQNLAYELIQRGEFPVRVLRLGRKILVPVADLDALLSEHGLVSYDREAQSAYLRLSRATVVRAAEVAADVVVDIAADGSAVGVELLRITSPPT